MSIEKIQERIIGKAKKEAEKLVSEEKEKIERERERFVSSQREIFDKKFNEMLSRINADTKRQIDQKRIEADRVILSKKRALLDELFDAVMDKFLSIDRETYKKFVASLILRDAPKGNSLVLFNKKDASLFNKKFIDEINKKLGKDRKISLSTETADIKGGCIIKGESVEIDDSLETLIADQRGESEMDIAKRLFGENK